MNRDVSLDQLRGVAILLVLLVHFGSFTIPGGDGLPNSIRVLVGLIGASGVDLFLVLSGFLITNILLSTKGRDTYFSHFYMRRALRILPIYAIFIAALFLLQILDVHPSGIDTQAFILTPFFLQNLLSVSGQSFDWPINISWSLCVEFHFYLLWPVLVASLNKNALKLTCWAMLALSLALRWWFISENISVGFFTLTRLDGLCFGALFALGFTMSSRARILALVGSLGLLAYLFLMGGDQPNYILALEGACWPIIYFIALYERNFLANLLPENPLVYIGRRSYAVYLIHAPIITMMMGSAFTKNPIVLIPLGLLLTFGLAEISWRLIEKPALSFKWRTRSYDLPSSFKSRQN